MRESALGSVFIFQERGIGLDNYKSKESLSRVVERVAQYLVSIQIKSSGVYMRLMCDQMETDFGDKE